MLGRMKKIQNMQTKVAPKWYVLWKVSLIFERAIICIVVIWSACCLLRSFSSLTRVTCPQRRSLLALQPGFQFTFIGTFTRYQSHQSSTFVYVNVMYKSKMMNKCEIDNQRIRSIQLIICLHLSKFLKIEIFRSLKSFSTFKNLMQLWSSLTILFN